MYTKLSKYQMHIQVFWHVTLC